MAREQEKNTVLLAMLIFLVALTLRAPFFWYPENVVFDEGLNATYATSIVHREPYFDVHPPFAHMLFALAVGPHEKLQNPLHEVGGSFGAFPYVRVRALNVFLGSLLAPIIFWISMFLFKNRAYALLSGFFMAFDNALIVYSRAILPDTILLLFGFLGALLFLMSLKRGFVFLIFAGAFFGAAASVKWIGLGFLAPALLYLLLKRRGFAIAVLLLAALFVYIAVFHIFFARFGGADFPERFETSYRYPDGASIVESALFLPKHTKTMFSANFRIPKHPYAASPAIWPFGQKFVWFWNSDGARIGLVPNLFLWWLVYLAVLLLSTLALMKYGSQTSILLLLLFAFGVMYLPFFIISRPLFVYHYFSALVVGYILLPQAIKEGASILAPRVSFEKAALWIALVAVASWALVSTATYGF